MTGKKYRKLRKTSNKDIAIKERAMKHRTDKYLLQYHVIRFYQTDDMFHLVESMKIMLNVLKSEGFPLEELALSKMGNWMKSYEKTIQA